MFISLRFPLLFGEGYGPNTVRVVSSYINLRMPLVEKMFSLKLVTGWSLETMFKPRLSKGDGFIEAAKGVYLRGHLLAQRFGGETRELPLKLSRSGYNPGFSCRCSLGLLSWPSRGQNRG